MRWISSSETLAVGCYLGYRIREAWRVRRPETLSAAGRRASFYSALWHDAAAQLGASVETLGDEILEIRRDHECTRVQQNTTSFDSAAAAAVARSKPVVHYLLSRRGLPMPAFCQFTMQSISKALSFLESIGNDCVVKPSDGGGGKGVTTGVRTPMEVIRASASAAIYGPNLMIEQQLQGEVFRMLYLDGRLMDAVERRSPTVVADGSSTIRELVDRENETRIKEGARIAHALIVIDTDLRSTLANQRLFLSSVPKHGTAVTLKTVINDNSHLENISARHRVCQSVIEDCASAASAVGVRFAGVDVITRDPSVPLLDSGGAILEVNTSPSYQHHYYKRDESYPVALYILPALLAAGMAEPHTITAKDRRST